MNEDETPEVDPQLEPQLPEVDVKPSNAPRYKSAEELALLAGQMTVPEAEKKLTDFQRKLVHNIVYKSMDRATACKAAGSQVDNRDQLAVLAYQTLRKPHVTVYMTYLMEKKNEIAGVDKVEVIEGLRDVLEQCLAESKYREALKALELLGSAIGLFKNVSFSSTTKKDKSSAIIDSGDDNESGAVKNDITKLLKVLTSKQTPPTKKE
jgi:hypothetical protein